MTLLQTKPHTSIESAVNVTDNFNERGLNLEPLVDLLGKVEEQGHESPILHGGALRDTFMGVVKPRDYDVFTSKFFRPDDSPQIPGVARKIIDIDGLRVDLNHRHDVQNSYHAAALGDVPLCSIAMGLDGQVWASPNFVTDAGRGDFYIPNGLPLNDYIRALDRFDKLRARIGGITLKDQTGLIKKGLADRHFRRRVKLSQANDIS